MSRKGWGIVLVVALLTVMVEIAVRSYSPAKGLVQIINHGDQPMENLSLSYEGATVELGRVAAGASASAYFGAGKRGSLLVKFNQQGNPLTDFRIEDFDPDQNRRDRFRLVLGVRNGQIERMMEDAPAVTLWDKASDALQSFWDSQMRTAK